MKTALIAVGGNSLIRAGEQGTIAQQLVNTRHTAQAIVQLLGEGYRIVLTHGNGPQVGAALLRAERTAGQVYGQTLDVCDACTQGEIGYLLEQALRNEIVRASLDVPVVTLITQSVVDENDRAFKHPTKPIGPFYTAEEAKEKAQEHGWTVVRDANRGYRRAVASPDPIDIVELSTIRHLMNSGTLVICAGGGGIPVVSRDGDLHGVDAVIDKDRASALLAAKLGVELLIISTDTDHVYLEHGTLMQQALHTVPLSDIERYYHEGQFPPGNMGPKIEAAIRFLHSGGERVVITTYENLPQAVAGRAGTQIVPNALLRRMPKREHESEPALSAR